MKQRSKSTRNWWLEIRTGIPCCIYYFGPFLTAQDAERHAGGYLDDLILEGAQEIWLIAKQCKPAELTIEPSQEQSFSGANQRSIGTEHPFYLNTY